MRSLISNRKQHLDLNCISSKVLVVAAAGAVFIDIDKGGGGDGELENGYLLYYYKEVGE